MATFLLVISLLLNGISIFFIIILYTRQNRILEAEKTQQQFKQDMEAEISAFLLEMKEENEEFIKRFQQISSTFPSNNKRTSTKPKSELNNKAHPKGISDQVDDSGSKELIEKAGHAFKKQAVKVYQKTIANTEEGAAASLHEMEEQPLNKKAQPIMGNEEIYRDLFMNQVKMLQSQGFSIEEIAKKLNKGKTEIELLLKFS
jgi:hypothetical protein